MASFVSKLNISEAIEKSAKKDKEAPEITDTQKQQLFKSKLEATYVHQVNA